MHILLLLLKYQDQNSHCLIRVKLQYNSRSRYYKTLFLCKRIIFLFFALKLGHFILNTSFFHLLLSLKLNSKIGKQRKTKLGRIDSWIHYKQSIENQSNVGSCSKSFYLKSYNFISKRYVYGFIHKSNHGFNITIIRHFKQHTFVLSVLFVKRAKQPTKGKLRC